MAISIVNVIIRERDRLFIYALVCVSLLLPIRETKLHHLFEILYKTPALNYVNFSLFADFKAILFVSKAYSACRIDFYTFTTIIYSVVNAIIMKTTPNILLI